MGSKLPAFIPVKRFKRDKRYTNAEQISPDDSASQYGVVKDQDPPMSGQTDGSYTTSQDGQPTTSDRHPDAPIDSERERKALAETHDTTTHTHTHGPTMTKLRKYLLLLSIFLLLVSIIFLILVIIAQITPSILPNVYFIKIDLSRIFIASSSMPSDIPFLNSVARSIGLHDYYQIGLWNFCEGYNSDGHASFCSPPVPLYWVNPVEIILSELLSGATIQLPADLLDILDLLKLASNAMFAFFIVGVVLTFLYLLLLPLSLLRREDMRPATRSCWAGFAVGMLGGLACLFTLAATVVATVMFFIMASVLGMQPELNIGCEVGRTMLAFMWTGSGAVLLAWVLQWRCGCCCRKVRREGRARDERRYGDGGRGVRTVEKSDSESRRGSLRERRSTAEMV